MDSTDLETTAKPPQGLFDRMNRMFRMGKENTRGWQASGNPANPVHPVHPVVPLRAIRGCRFCLPPYVSRFTHHASRITLNMNMSSTGRWTGTGIESRLAAG